MQLPLVGKLKRPLPWILGLVIISALSISVLVGRLLQNSANNIDVEQLTVAVKRESVELEIEASGTVEPIQSVNISPKNPGLLKQLLVDQGVSVKQGQTLAVMDNQALLAQQAEAEARLAQANANLDAAKIRIPAQIEQAKMQVAQAKARLDLAKARIPRQIQQAQSQVEATEVRLRLAASRRRRNQDLVEEGAIPDDDFDAVENEYLDAQVNRQEARQRLEELKNTKVPEIGELAALLAEAQSLLQQNQQIANSEIAQLQAAVEAAKAERDRVSIQYQETFVIAPFAGIITQKYATEGAFVTPTTSASSTASATSSSILALAKGLEIVAKVPEVDISLLSKGQSVRVIADAFPEESFKGEVALIAPEAIVEQNVTSFEVTIRLLTGLDKLRSKMNVDVTFLGEKLDETLTIPTVAIVTRAGKTGVMVPNEDNQPAFQPVRIGLVLEEKTQILDGLSSGERVFIDLPETKPDEE